MVGKRSIYNSVKNSKAYRGQGVGISERTKSDVRKPEPKLDGEWLPAVASEGRRPKSPLRTVCWSLQVPFRRGSRRSSQTVGLVWGCKSDVAANSDFPRNQES